MATITLNRPASELDLDSMNGDSWVESASGSRIVVGDGYNREIYSGRFLYSDYDLVGGTLTGYTFSQGGKTFVTISSLSVSAMTFYNALSAGDSNTMFELFYGASDLFKGTAYNDYMDSYTGNDTLFGYAGDDTLYGQAGDDILDGGAGVDVMFGGVGNDTYVIDSLSDSIEEFLYEGTDQVKVAVASANGTYLLGSHIENATLINNVDFNLSGNAFDNILTGNSRANRIDGSLGADQMNGGAGNDTYVVDDADDLITDSAGIDTVEASISYTLADKLEKLILTGSDATSGTGNSANNTLDASQNNAANLLQGLAGNDIYIVGSGDSVIEASGGGIDLVQSQVDFTLGDHLENLTLLSNSNLAGTGNALNNLIIGNSGNNILDGMAGKDTLQGGAGDDTYWVDLTSKNTLEDIVKELRDAGNDTLIVRGGDINLGKAVTLPSFSQVENIDISLTGSTLLNLKGNELNNTLTGNAANNLLDGSTGNDILIGGVGADSLIGGTGSDIFRFGALEELGIGSGNRDIIRDFRTAQGDLIDLSALGSFTYSGSSYDLGGAGLQVRFEGGVLYGSLDGGSSTSFEIELLGVSTFGQGDLFA